MAATNIIVGPDVALVTDTSGTVVLSGTPLLANTGIVIAPIAAQMDGAASVTFIARVSGAARMDGAAAAAFTGIVIAHFGSAQMDGATSAAFAGSMIYRSAAQMNGAASMVAASVPPPVPAIAQMDGAASMIATGAVTGPKTYNTALVQKIGMQLTLVPVWNLVLHLTQNLALGQTTNQKFIWGRALTDTFKVSAAAGARGTYKQTLAQLLKLSDIEGLRLSHPIALTQNLSVHPSLVGGMSLKLLQKFLVATSSSPLLHYHLALASRVVVGDILGHFTRAILTQLFTVHPALNRQFVANSSLAQLLTVHPALNNKLVLQIVGNLQLSANELVHMLYRGDPLLDGVTITALYVSPSGTTTTWAVNTRTNAVTEYLNYDFRSFAMMGNRYVAAGSGGLYELDGDTDDGTSIIAEMMSGYLQLNEKKMFGIKGAYIAIRGGGRFYLKLVSGDGREYVYELRAQPNLMTTKVKVGKGLKTTYLAFDLVTEGQDFDLDSIEFIPMTSGRRV